MRTLVLTKEQLYSWWKGETAWYKWAAMTQLVWAKRGRGNGWHWVQ